MPKVKVTSSQGLYQQSGAAPLESTVGISVGVQSVTAAGSNQSTAAEISAAGGALVLVTGADSTKGVKLPALSSVPVGTLFLVQNLNPGQTLEVYPSLGDKVLPGTDNAAITIAASAMMICVAADGDQWVGAEPAVITV